MMKICTFSIKKKLDFNNLIINIWLNFKIKIYFNLCLEISGLFKILNIYSFKLIHRESKSHGYKTVGYNLPISQNFTD